MDIRILDDFPEAEFRISPQTNARDPQNLAVFVSSVLAPPAILHLPKSDATIHTVMPADQAESVLIDTGEAWRVDRDGGNRTESVDAESTVMIIAAPQHSWRRTVDTSGIGPPRLRYRHDGATRQRSVVWMYPEVSVDLWSAHVYLERWQLATQGD